MSLEAFLGRAVEQIEDFYDPRQVTQWVLDEVHRKHKSFPHWEKKVRFSYASYRRYHKDDKQKHEASKQIERSKILKYYYHDDKIGKDKLLPDRNISKVIPKEPEFKSLSFFNKKLDEFLDFFLREILPLNDGILARSDDPLELYKDLQIKYEYTFTEKQVETFREFREDTVPEEPLEKMIEFIFTILILVMGILMNRIIKENFEIEVIAARMSLREKPKIVFVVSIRQRERILNEFYLKTELFHFSEIFSKHIPQDFRDRLKTEKNLIYLLALDRYRDIDKHIVAVLGRIFNKCHTLNHITPILDFMNFVCSRVEDSSYNTDELLKEYLTNKEYSKNKIEAVMDVFRYINNNAGLFATYQSNNRPQLASQYHLFILYTQYFCLNPQSLFLQPEYIERIQESQEKYEHSDIYMAIFQEYLLNSFFLSQYPSIDIFVKSIFDNDLMVINEDFFSAFLQSVNIKFFEKLDGWSSELAAENLEYKQVLQIITDALYYIIERVFLDQNPEKASHNFRDRRGRYSPKRVALRTLELIMFREMPLSDNNWQNYNLSRHKEKVRELFSPFINIPDDLFFTRKRLVHINMMYLYGIERRSKLEEWLITDIIHPFFEFCHENFVELEKSIAEVEENREKVQHILYEQLYARVSKGIIKDRTLDDLEFMSDWLTELLSKHFIAALE